MTVTGVDLPQLFADAGVEGRLLARDLATGAEVAHGADELVVLASVFKVPVLLELHCQGEEGRLDLTAPVAVPAEGRTLGPFGISLMRDPLQMSLRDLAWLMTGISDNAATEVICDAVGVERVNARLQSLGLRSTVLIGACRDLFQTMAEDLADVGGLEADLTDPAVVDRMRVLDPAATSHTTPRDITDLLTLIWTDRAGSPDVCAEVRQTLATQVWPHRLAAGFPEDGVVTSGKTGTLPRLRNEVGVVEYADGGRYAVSVFTRSASASRKNAPADAVIGAAARAAVEELRA